MCLKTKYLAYDIEIVPFVGLPETGTGLYSISLLVHPILVLSEDHDYFNSLNKYVYIFGL